MGKNTELWSRFHLIGDATARLRAGRKRSEGVFLGSLGEIIAQRVDVLLQDTAQITDTNFFGLTIEEVEIIGCDIEKNLPLIASGAIRKLLKSLGFTEVRENTKTNILVLGVNQYEVVNAIANRGPLKNQKIPVIRMPNHILQGDHIDMFRSVSSAIRSIFPDKNLGFTLDGLIVSANVHGIYPGFRNANDGKLCDEDDVLCSWIDGSSTGLDAAFAWCNSDGNTYSSMDSCHNGLCLVPDFG